MKKKEDYTTEELAKIIFDLHRLVDKLLPGLKLIPWKDYGELNEICLEAEKVNRAFGNEETKEPSL